MKAVGLTISSEVVQDAREIRVNQDFSSRLMTILCVCSEANGLPPLSTASVLTTILPLKQKYFQTRLKELRSR